jgi:hypothetical protein
MSSHWAVNDIQNGVPDSPQFGGCDPGGGVLLVVTVHPAAWKAEIIHCLARPMKVLAVSPPTGMQSQRDQL